MKIAFVTDGGVEMGMGHIYRSIALANELSRNDIYFFTKSDSIVVEKISKMGFYVYSFESDSDILNELKTLSPDVTIIDRLDIDEEFSRFIKNNTNSRLTIIENLNANSNKYADVVINALLGNKLGAEYKNIRSFDEKNNTVFFYGPKYLILKDDFFKHKEKITTAISSVLLIFGGSDPSNFTCKALKELLKTSSLEKVDIIIGSGFIFNKELKEIIDGNNSSEISIYKDVSNVAELMSKTDLVITSPGLSVFEALSVYTPVIVFHHSEWQKKGFSGFMKTLSSEDIYQLCYLIDNNKYFDPNSCYIKSLEIGRGKKELIMEMIGEREI